MDTTIQIKHKVIEVTEKQSRLNEFKKLNSEIRAIEKRLNEIRINHKVGIVLLKNKDESYKMVLCIDVENSIS